MLGVGESNADLRKYSGGCLHFSNNSRQATTSYTMPSRTPATYKRKRTEEALKGKAPKKQKKVKRQREYHSSSEDESDEEGIARDAPREDPADVRPKQKKILATGSNAVQKIEPVQKIVPVPEEAAAEEQLDSGNSSAEEQDGGVEVEAEVDELQDAEESSAEEQDEFDIDEEDSGDDDSDASEDSETSETSTAAARKVRKRNDPEAFATSMSRILGSKLTSQKRSEPILSRSKTAQETNKSLADHKLTLKASRAITAEKKAAQEKGRVKDVLGLQKADVSTAEIVAEEKRLQRTAQKGVIQLFNAVRAAQVKGEQAEKEARQTGVVGITKREEKVKEMSKQGFLDMIAGGGK